MEQTDGWTNGRTDGAIPNFPTRAEHNKLNTFDAFAARSLYTQDEMTSRSLWSRYDRHFVGISRYNALS